MQKSWYSWKGNQISWEDSTSIVYIIFALTIIASILIWIYGQKIRLFFAEDRRYFKNKISRATLFRIMGFIGLTIMMIKLTMWIAQDWPWKWEFLHLHMCRSFALVVCFLLIFNKIEKVKYIAFYAILGAILGILFSNAKITPEFQAGERQYFGYAEGTEAWNNAGFTWGWDNFYFYEFLWLHNFLILSVVFMSVVGGEKARVNLVVFYRSAFFILMSAIIIFFANWIMNAISQNLSKSNQVAWDANWIFLGKEGIGTFGKYSRWPFSIVTLPIAFLLGVHIFFLTYSWLTSIEFYFETPKSWKLKVRMKNYKTNFKTFVLPKKYFFNFKVID